MKFMKKMWNEHPLAITWSLIGLQLVPVIWYNCSDRLAARKIKIQADAEMAKAALRSMSDSGTS